MKQLLLHPTTEFLVASLRRDMPQSLLLTGEKGVGLLTFARHLQPDTSTIVLQPKNAKGELDQAIGTISVEAIRQLYEQSRTKTTNPRIIIIDDADRMSRGAQSAFLKLLEEPPTSTFFILTSHTEGGLLPTIRSRVQHLYIQSVTTEQSRSFIADQKVDDPTKQTQLLFLAEGLPAELFRLIHDSEYFATRAAIISDARQLITASPYQKLRTVHKYRQDREGAVRLIDSAITILKYSLRSKPQYAPVTQLNLLLEAREKIVNNQNVSLQLSHAVV